MRPVNLLPPKYRPYVPTGARAGSAYVAVGGLAVLLVATVAYLITVSGIRSDRAATARAKADADRAELRAGSLGGYAKFHRLKATREESVRQLAAGRFDWERMLRELARVLPSDVYVTQLSAELGGAKGGEGSGAAGGTGAGGQAASATQAGAGASPGATLTLKGCAPSQPDVATAIVRLRQLHRAEEVTLTSSTRASSEGAGSGGGAAPSCRGYEFDAAVTFEAREAVRRGGPDDGSVPGPLGGGA